MNRTVLIVDDDPVQRRLLEANVTRLGYQTLLADSGDAALAIVERADPPPIAVVVLDFVMPGTDGIGVLERFRQIGFSAPVIVQTAQGGIETVVRAMRHGAFDFVVKPASPERLGKAISDALKVEAVGESAAKSASKSQSPTFKSIVTSSTAYSKTLRLAEKAAATTIPILIEGESGVGKEHLARAIQAAGDRKGKPFVTVNCGAIPDNLVESILFGHEKGSFTGATDKHPGKFVEANGGTLFLDEIGDLPLDVQVKLLRAVQEGEVDPVGGRNTVKVDIRLISATHRDLLQQVKLGKFREDLFYRLNVYPITVPPLRVRRYDIAQLVEQFILRLGTSGAQRIRGISPGALKLLQSYEWPGNIRQLENAIFRACVLSESDLLTEAEFPHIAAQLDGSLAEPVEEVDENQRIEVFEPIDSQVEALAAIPRSGLLRSLDDYGEVRPLVDVEREMIAFAIDHYDGQMSEVARRLGIGRSTLYRKLKEYGLDATIGDGETEIAV